MKKQILLFLMFACTMANAQQEIPLVTVTGEGTVNVVPDKVLLQTRVEHEANNIVEAKNQNDKVINAVIKYLRGEGVKEKNIKTTHVNLGKNYDYQTKTYTYTANQSIAIILEDISRYEKIVAGLFKNGLNRIDGIQFQSSEIEKHQKEARKRAVLNAREKALAYAEALGQTIGTAFQINETGNNQPLPMYRMEAMKMDSSASGEQVLAPGEMEVKAEVNVSFHLK